MIEMTLSSDTGFEPWRSEAEHATSRSRRLLTILTFTRGWGRNIFVSLKPPRPGVMCHVIQYSMEQTEQVHNELRTQGLKVLATIVLGLYREMYICTRSRVRW